MLNFPEKFYVGIRAKKDDGDEYPLAFATPFGTDKAYEKRKKTVDEWNTYRHSYKDETGNWKYETLTGTNTVFDNVPMSGFVIDRSVSRWSTSNKWFRISDPRGFQLEISADNLCDIIGNTTIKNGVIDSPLVWARGTGSNYLTRLDHPDYLTHLNVVEGGAYVHDIGDYIKKDFRVYKYIGKFYGHVVERESSYVYENSNSYRTYHGRYNEVITYRDKGVSKNSYYVYAFVGWKGTVELEVRRSTFKTGSYFKQDPSFDFDIDMDNFYKIVYGREAIKFQTNKVVGKQYSLEEMKKIIGKD